MILEVAHLNVIPGREEDFLDAFSEAQKIISTMDGYIEHELKRCVERTNRFLLLVKWKSLEDHTVGFRNSPDYQKWKVLLHHFYEPFPEVEHFE